MYTYTFNEFTQETSSTTATLEYLHHQNWNTKHRCLDQMDTLYLWGACIYGMLINAYYDTADTQLTTANQTKVFGTNEYLRGFC